MPVSDLLRNKLLSLPESPGVYLMLNEENKILYIGKAKNLKNRVQSYFYKVQERLMTQRLVLKICDIDVINTNTEKEALLLEDNLIKQHQPPYNINLKDNKTYPYLKLVTNVKYPQILKTRVVKDDGQLYFGPYTDLGQLYGHLKSINDLFPLKKCGVRRFSKNHKPCLYYHMNKCLPYCTPEGVPEERVKTMLHSVKQILSGKNKDILDNLKKLMKTYSEKQEYELALRFRERIKELEHHIEHQLINLLDRKNFDVVNYYTSSEHISFVVLHFQSGILHNKSSFHYENELIESAEGATSEEYLKSLLSNFMMQFYKNSRNPISHVVIPLNLNDQEDLIEIIGAYLYQDLGEALQKKFQLSLIAPKIGTNKRLLQLAYMNAKLSFEELLRSKEKASRLSHLKKLLKLPQIPKTIDSFDIANTGDKAIIAGMVQYVEGEKHKNGYRLFNIKNTKTQNDFLSIYEAVFRRYKRLIEENKPLPELIMIDGGKGQLNMALKALGELNIFKQPIISLAKKEELIFVPKQTDPIEVDIKNPALSLLIEIRDETHRFVNSSHKRKRDKQDIQSLLLKIPKVGPKKKEILMERFSSLKEISYASKETLLSLPGFTLEDVENIQNFLKPFV